MNAEKFFNQIRTYINNNATHANDELRKDARTCGANNISVFAGEYEFSIEGRNAGRGYVTVRRNQVMVATNYTLDYLFNADDAIGATLAILELQDKQRGEDAIALGDDAAQSPIEIARRLIAEGHATGRLKTEVESAERMANIIATCLLEGREPGPNVRDALMVSENYIKQYVAAYAA